MTELTVKNLQNKRSLAVQKTNNQGNMKMRIILVLGIPILAFLAAAMLTNMRPEPPKKERVNLDPLVEAIVLETMTENFRVRSQGTVRPKTETILSAEVSGTITEISPQFVAGGVFQANDVLLRIDPTNYTVAVEQAQALVAQRDIEHDGAKKLKSQGYRAAAEYASAVAALATARTELVRAQHNLEKTYIRLPYEGMVRAKETDIGQYVSPGVRLGVVFATDYAEVRLPLTQLDLAFVDLPDGRGDGPTVTLSAVKKGRSTEWAARIVRTEGVVDEKSRVTYVVASIADPYRQHTDGVPLPMGTFVSASISGSKADNIIRVPRAVLRGSNQLIFIDEKNTLRIRNVNIVRSDADYVYVDGGAAVGERVVATALESPVNGMLVRTTTEKID